MLTTANHSYFLCVFQLFPHCFTPPFPVIFRHHSFQSKILHLVWLPFVSSAVSVTTDLYQNISDYWQLLRKLASRFWSIFDARLRIKPYRVMASLLADYTAHEVFNVHQFAFLRSNFTAIIIRFLANASVCKKVFWK